MASGGISRSDLLHRLLAWGSSVYRRECGGCDRVTNHTETKQFSRRKRDREGRYVQVYKHTETCTECDHLTEWEAEKHRSKGYTGGCRW